MRAAFPVALVLLATFSPTGAALLGETKPLLALQESPLRGDALWDDPAIVATAAGVPLAAGIGEFLVGYREGTRDAVLLSIQLAGGTVLHEDPGLRLALAQTGNASRFTVTLSVHPGVEFIDANDETRLSGAQWNGAEWNGAEWNGAEWNGGTDGAGEPARSFQWGLAETRAPEAWDRTRGTRSADLCVLDSGIDLTHRDLAANAWTGPRGNHGWDFVSRDADPSDDAGHGTHVAGVAAAAVGDAWGIAGVGDVRLMAVKVLDAKGRGTEAGLAFGLAWCADNGAEVALMALSSDKPGPALDRALNHAADHGVLLVASAGNGGPCGDCVAYPASHPRVLAVAATTPGRTLASFSGAGRDVDLAAPGVDILGPLPGGRFAYGSGTSQAAAFVAGAAALVRDAHPGLSAEQARDALIGGALDLGPAGRDATYGHGLLDVARALARADAGGSQGP